MTKRNKIRSTAVLVLYALLSVSCINSDKSLGSDYIPADQLLSLKSAEFSVPVQMKMADSLQTIYSGAVIIGAYKDPTFGTTTSGAAFQVIPAKTGNSFGDNPTPNYIKLMIAVGNKLVLEESQASIPQNIYVYKLKKSLDSTQAYNNSITLADVEPTPINESTVYMGGDSIVCKLSLSYASELLAASTNERDTVKAFLRKFKGLYISTEPLPGSLTGGRFNIITPGDIYFLLSYKHKEVAKKIDKADSLLIYYVSDGGPSVNCIKHSSKGLETSSPTNKLYIEGLAGIKPYIDFKTVKADMAVWAAAKNIDLKKVVIAKAQLIFPFEFPSDYKIISQFPSKLFLSVREKETSTKNVLYQPIDDINIENSDGSMNRSDLTYKLDITTFLQKILKGSYTSDNELKTWLTPVLEKSDYASGATVYYTDNSTYYKATINGNLSTRAPKLIVTYAILP